ncbi:hypothetical protein LJR118_004382 [Acidovorax sp. LjRoot118]|uniref:hypothetical protein n=1 Tax=unclassified Acidovorax TaxID=2684926 RepID=UPI00138F87C1|nr:hypothetical protein [Acidovorax sp. Root217]
MAYIESQAQFVDKRSEAFLRHIVCRDKSYMSKQALLKCSEWQGCQAVIGARRGWVISLLSLPGSKKNASVQNAKKAAVFALSPKMTRWREAMGRRRTPLCERLQCALAFRALQQDLGVSYYSMSRRWIEKDDPEASQNLTRVPEYFKRYAEGKVPLAGAGLARLNWARRSKLFCQTYDSHTFTVLSVMCDWRSLDGRAFLFAFNADETRDFFRSGAWWVSDALQDFAASAHIDALGQLVICLGESVGKEDEQVWVHLCRVWLRSWARSGVDRKLETLMVQTLAEHVPHLSPLLRVLYPGSMYLNRGV